MAEEVTAERLGRRDDMVEEVLLLLMRIVDEEVAVARLTTCLGLEHPSQGKGSTSAQRDNVLEGCVGQDERKKTHSGPDCVGSHTLAFVCPTP